MFEELKEIAKDIPESGIFEEEDGERFADILASCMTLLAMKDMAEKGQQINMPKDVLMKTIDNLEWVFENKKKFGEMVADLFCNERMKSLILLLKEFL